MSQSLRDLKRCYVNLNTPRNVGGVLGPDGPQQRQAAQPHISSHSIIIIITVIDIIMFIIIIIIISWHY